MNIWLYAASRAFASSGDTLSLARRSGFVWRSFYNANGVPIACVKDIRVGDDLLLGYRNGGIVNLLSHVFVWVSPTNECAAGFVVYPRTGASHLRQVHVDELSSKQAGFRRRFEFSRVVIYLTQVATTCSMAGGGGISSKPEGI